MACQKEKKSKKNKGNEEGVKESKHSRNVVVQDDKGVFEKDVMKKKNVDKGDTKKKKTKEKVNMGTEESDKRILEKKDILGENNIHNDVLETNDGDKGDREKKMNKKKKKKKKVNIHTEDGGIEGKKGIEDGGIMSRCGDEEVMKDVDQKKKKKKKKKRVRDKDDMSSGEQDSTVWKATDSGKEDGKGLEVSGEGRDGKSKDKTERKKKKREKGQTKDDLEGVGVTAEGSDMKKVERKKSKKEKGGSIYDLGAEKQDNVAKNLAFAEGNLCSTENVKQNANAKNNNKGKRKKANPEKEGSDNPKPKKGKKKVRFSGQVEVFPLSGDPESQKSEDGEDKLVQGKRFSCEEDEIIKEAVSKYIEEHALGEEGLKMVLNCKSYPEVKDCWKHIAKAIPYRPRASVYYRAQVLYRRGEKRKWTEEEYEELRRFQEKHGNQWKVLAEEFGKHRFHVKDTWRRIKFLNRKKGHWSQDEYQTLFDLVNTDLQMKLSEEKKTKHGMLRDNIHWTAISDKLSTRSDALCCMKWYNQLTSPMVAEGLWADADDYRLINELYSLDSSCLEDVDWDNLLDHRSGDVCRKRWNQMVLHIGQHVTKSFAEQVEILAGRYCPHLIEVREAWDSKPAVD